MMGRASLARAAGIAVASSLVCAAGVSHAATVTLQNDGFVDGDSIGLQSGFAASEAAGVTLGPVDGPFTVEKVQLIFGPASGNRTVTLSVYLDDGGDDPGTLLHEADYELQSAEDAIIEIDLSAEDIQVASGSIRVAVLFQHTGAPSVARDDDGSIQGGRNWIYTEGSWFDSETFGLEGDWVIRAEVETEDDPGPSSTAAGSTSADASSSADASGATSGTTTGVGPGSSGATGGATVCTPGETQACFGDGACQGGQSCLPDGTGWDACTCGGSGDGGASGDEGEGGGEDEGCGCSLPGARHTGGAAIALAMAGLAAAVARRRRSR
jgi:MYXO-CTERM domain-containing protein